MNLIWKNLEEKETQERIFNLILSGIKEGIELTYVIVRNIVKELGIELGSDEVRDVFRFGRKLYNIEWDRLILVKMNNINVVMENIQRSWKLK